MEETTLLKSCRDIVANYINQKYLQNNPTDVFFLLMQLWRTLEVENKRGFKQLIVIFLQNTKQVRVAEKYLLTSVLPILLFKKCLLLRDATNDPKATTRN